MRCDTQVVDELFCTIGLLALVTLAFGVITRLQRFFKGNSSSRSEPFLFYASAISLLLSTDPIQSFTNAVKLDRLNLEITIMMLVVLMTIIIIMMMIMIIIMIMIMILIIIITDNDDNRTNYKTVMIILITMY